MAMALLSFFLPYKIHKIFFIHFFVIFTLTAAQDIREQCRICGILVKGFMEGLDKTVNLHFGGGNTDWEEKKLGKFRASEIRFVEVMEYVCTDNDKENRFKCHSMAEKHEELLDEWFFEHQESGPSLEQFLCNDKLEFCCPQGYYGPECSPCPGIKQSEKVCFGRGGCDGSGTRTGNGNCSCWLGYVGKMCSNCDSNYFALEKNSTFIKCQVCHPACAGGCTADGPKGCNSCRSGYLMHDELGCKDIDECSEGDKCTKQNEQCLNTDGAYKCECADGFKRNGQDDCELDVEEETDQEEKHSSEEAEEDEQQEDEDEMEKKDDDAKANAGTAEEEKNDETTIDTATTATDEETKDEL